MKNLISKYRTTIEMILFGILCFLTGATNAQTVDTVIHSIAYTSYFNYSLHEPLYVQYKLINGGGNCSRTGDHFISGGLKNSATAQDYKGGGYDEGHLADSKDFAYDCSLQKATFFFYNCVPQTPKLNRGSWKQLETKARKESQGDTLNIYCGGIFTTKKLKNIAVPAQCWKVVFSKNGLLHCDIFPNDNSNIDTPIPLDSLKKIIPYRVEWPN